MKGIIYKYTSPSGKSYIGQTINEESRKTQHRNSKSKTAFANAIRKYGFDNMNYEVVFTVETKSERFVHGMLNCAEQHYIKEYDTFNHGYNLTSGGDANYSVSEESRKKMSVSKKGENHPLYGKNLSAEHKQKLSEAKKAKIILCMEKL